MLGHEMLASTATTATGAGVGDGSAATRAGSPPAVKPQMLATTVAPVASERRELGRQPGVDAGVLEPDAVQHARVEGCRRGAGLPSQGSADTDLTTTAPRPARSM